MYEKELEEKKLELIKKLNEYILTATWYVNNSNDQKTVILEKGKFVVKGSTEGKKIKRLSEDEKLILAYEASKSESKIYNSKMLKNILELRRKTFNENEEIYLENLQRTIAKLESPTETIITEHKKSFLMRKKEQFKMLKDKKTRADAISLLLGTVAFGDDKYTITEEVRKVLSKEDKSLLQKYKLMLSLLNGETKRFVEEQLKSQIKEEQLKKEQETKEAEEKAAQLKKEQETKEAEEKVAQLKKEQKTKKAEEKAAQLKKEQETKKAEEKAAQLKKEQEAKEAEEKAAQLKKEQKKVYKIKPVSKKELNEAFEIIASV